MREFKEINIDVYSVDPSKIRISWIWKESMLPLNRYTIDIYRGESPEELSLIASNLPAIEADHFEDYSAKLKDKHRVYYYQIIAHDSRLKKDTKSNIATWDGPLDFVGLYIVEEHEFLFKSICGSPVLVYKKQTEGDMRCDECWDPISKHVTKSNCRSCHGSGFIGRGVGGYYSPSFTWVDFQPDSKIIGITQWGRSQPGQTDVFMSNYPRLSPGDLVIELLTNKRWKVERINQTEKRRVPMLQIVRLTQIDLGDIEHKVPVSVDFIEKARKEYNERSSLSEF